MDVKAREDTMIKAYGLMGALIAIGIVAGCFLLSGGLIEMKSAGRYVTVRGFSEREVKADLVIWPVVFKTTAQDLTGLNSLVEDNKVEVINYLKSCGFEETEYSTVQPLINDNWSNWSGTPIDKTGPRYVAQTTVTLRTQKVDETKKAMQGSGVLIGKGVALAQDWELRPEFIYTGLDSIKPEMIAEATQSARKSAEQFAKDSDSQVGNIKTAEQGYFSIEDRDKGTPDYKKVRVVTTIQYFLKN